MIEYCGRLTEEQFRDYVRLAVKPRQGITIELPVLLAAICVLVAVWSALYAGGPAALWWLVAAAPLLAWWAVTRPRASKIWRETPAAQLEHFGRVEPDALDWSPGSEPRVPWRQFDGFVESPGLVVLQLGRRRIPLARGFFASDQEWQAAMEIVHKNVASPAGSSEPAGRMPRTLALWLLLMAVMFSAWCFHKQRPSANVRPPSMQR